MYLIWTCPPYPSQIPVLQEPDLRPGSKSPNPSEQPVPSPCPAARPPEKPQAWIYLKEAPCAEIGELYEYLCPLYETGLDAVIVQDLGVMRFVRTHFPQLSIHASTQMTVTGAYGAKLLLDQGCSRIVTARDFLFPHTVCGSVFAAYHSFFHGRVFQK